MAPGVITGRTKPTKVKKQESKLKRKREDVDVEKLEQGVDELVCVSYHLTPMVDARCVEITRYWAGLGSIVCQGTFG
jgi:hypothetical protein